MMSSSASTSDVDVIVIGAGNAGLTAAVRLAQSGAATLLLEQHNIPGECATSFRRGRFEFEVALHQLSGLGTEGHPFQIRQLLGELGVLERLEFVYEPDLYRVTISDLVDVTLPADKTGIVDALAALHPAERPAVGRFLDLVTMSSRSGLPSPTWAARSSGRMRRRRSTRCSRITRCTRCERSWTSYS